MICGWCLLFSGTVVVSDTCTLKADAEHLMTKMKGGVQRGLVLRYLEELSVEVIISHVDGYAVNYQTLC